MVLTLTLTFLLTLILGVWWVVVDEGLTSLAERVRSIVLERRPTRHPAPARGIVFEQMWGIQCRGTRSGGCPGPVRGVRGGCARWAGGGAAFPCER
jgi:hypothetical protein